MLRPGPRHADIIGASTVTCRVRTGDTGRITSVQGPRSRCVRCTSWRVGALLRPTNSSEQRCPSRFRGASRVGSFGGSGHRRGVGTMDTGAFDAVPAACRSLHRAGQTDEMGDM